MRMFTDVLDWAADKVQTITGEKERRKYVSEIKKSFNEYKDQTIKNIEDVNDSIENLNFSISKLNMFRASGIPKNIEMLEDFLGHFGNVKEIGAYAEESRVSYLTIPEQHFLSVEDYITEIDWSKEDVFINSFFLTPIGIKYKTRKQNLSMQEQLNTLKIEAEQTIIELKKRKYVAEQDKKIVDLYIVCVEVIINYIEYIIIPELEIVEAFFQALTITNKVIVDESLEHIEFKNNLNLIKDSQFHVHYQFVKNTFMFYVIACKIYQTPILTRLLNGITTEDDVEELKIGKEVLEAQITNINQFLIFERKER